MYGPKVRTWAHITWEFAWVVPLRQSEGLCQQRSPEFRMHFTSEGYIGVKKKKKKKRNLVPSVHVVLHLRPCICSRSSFYRWLLLYKPGSGPWVIPRHFRRLEPFFSELLTTSLVQTERKTQMLGLELSGLTGEHVVHFHFESFLIVCLPKRPEENV